MENYHLQAVELAVGAGAGYFRRAKGDHREPWIVSPSLRPPQGPLSPQRKALMLSRTIAPSSGRRFDIINPWAAKANNHRAAEQHLRFDNTSATDLGEHGRETQFAVEVHRFVTQYIAIPSG
ncbi:MAG: hypothetical protein ACTHOU_02450 [Aureliella sp.]